MRYPRGLFCFSILIGFLYLNSSCSSDGSGEFSIITYNVWNGFENELSRRDTFAQWAVGQDADVIAFQELNGYTEGSFGQLAKKWGHPYAVIVKEDGYPVGISSKHPINNIYRLIEGMHHGGLYAEINGINFFVVHFSPFSSAKRREEAEAVLTLLEKKNKLGERTMILGDFNAFSPYDSLNYAETGLRDRMFLQQQKNDVLRNLNTGNEIDYQVIDRFLKEGFFDSFSLFHRRFESSYPTKVFPSVSPDDYVRIDHALISKKLKRSCKEVELIKDPVTDTLSDHHPLKIVFRPEK